MKFNFHHYPAVDFFLRLMLTAVIVSPAIYFSWDDVKKISGSDCVPVLLFGFFWLLSYLFLTSLTTVFQKKWVSDGDDLIEKSKEMAKSCRDYFCSCTTGPLYRYVINE